MDAECPRTWAEALAPHPDGGPLNHALLTTLGNPAEYGFAIQCAADALEEIGSPAAAAARRATRTWRYPGCRWPRPRDLPGLSPHQRERLEEGLRAPVCLLTGTPGTGKTFVLAQAVRAVLHGWAEAARQGGPNSPNRVAVAAPTGKAAVRVTTALRQAMADDVYARPPVATTIHQLLAVSRNGHDQEGWGFRFNESNPLPLDFLFIDEASMLDTALCAALFRAILPGTHVLLVGDPHQLPPVGHGFPLRDLVAGGVPCAELTEIRRNSGAIVEQCRVIREGGRIEATPWTNTPDSWAAAHNLAVVAAKTPQEQGEQVARLVRMFNGAGWGAADVQVLVATNKGHDAARAELNLALQSLCNPNGYAVRGNPFKIGDKVICTRNGWYDSPQGDDDDDDVYVANGEIGRVVGVATGWADVQFSTGDATSKTACFCTRPVADDDDDDEESPADNAANSCHLQLAYAITTHKSQGSEWPVAIVVLDPTRGAARICDRHWVYTAISRAKQLCILVGDLGVARQMCKRDVAAARLTFLAEGIRDGR